MNWWNWKILELFEHKLAWEKQMVNETERFEKPKDVILIWSCSLTNYFVNKKKESRRNFYFFIIFWWIEYCIPKCFLPPSIYRSIRLYCKYNQYILMEKNTKRYYIPTVTEVNWEPQVTERTFLPLKCFIPVGTR